MAQNRCHSIVTGQGTGGQKPKEKGATEGAFPETSWHQSQEKRTAFSDGEAFIPESWSIDAMV
jgi:hypothetical protein